MTAANGAQPALAVAVHVALGSFPLAVELAFGPGITALFGPSGAGKSTLLEVIAGLRRDAAGTVRWRDTAWLDTRAGRFVPPEARGIGYVPQDGRLFPHLTVRGNLRAGTRRARAAGLAPDHLVATAAELLELEALLDREVDALSGGEQQRVALARALCSAPALLLLDEPLGALDLALRRRLQPLLARVCRQAGVPVVLVSHDPTEVAALASEVVLLDRGRVVARGAPPELLARAELGGAPDAPGYDNVWVAVVSAVDEDLCRLRIGAPDGVELVAQRREATLGDEVVVTLPSRDVMIAVEPPRGLSARNALPAVIARIVGDRRRLVTAELVGRLPIVAELSGSACDSLGLRAGRAVTVVFKASSCRVDGPSRPTAR